MATEPSGGASRAGKGGVGSAPNFTVNITEEYHLDSKPCDLLEDNGIINVSSLLEIQDNKLGDFLEVGYRAELRWALARMLLEKVPTIQVGFLKGENTPSIQGGHGGAGGDGLNKGGDGGTSEAPHIGLHEVFRFNVIRGGIGGDGGASGVMWDLGNADATGWYSAENGPSGNLYGQILAAQYGRQAMYRNGSKIVRERAMSIRLVDQILRFESQSF
ncbi:hypothetical protein C8R45DRAFT_1097801 [Mycena sanguinolenta]|nr:hypothetical protein C8R45DRAFT_1097801 [Mycena sanguinolenta]